MPYCAQQSNGCSFGKKEKKKKQDCIFFYHSITIQNSKNHNYKKKETSVNFATFIEHEGYNDVDEKIDHDDDFRDSSSGNG